MFMYVMENMNIMREVEDIEKGTSELKIQYLGNSPLDYQLIRYCRRKE